MLIIITIFLHENVVACSEGNTDEDKEKIGNGEIQDQQVCCVLHLRVRHHLVRRYHGSILLGGETDQNTHHKYNQGVANETNDEDDGKGNGDNIEAVSYTHLTLPTKA